MGVCVKSVILLYYSRLFPYEGFMLWLTDFTQYLGKLDFFIAIAFLWKCTSIPFSLFFMRFSSPFLCVCVCVSWIRWQIHRIIWIWLADADCGNKLYPFLGKYSSHSYGCQIESFFLGANERLMLTAPWQSYSVFQSNSPGCRFVIRFFLRSPNIFYNPFSTLSLSI